MIIILDSGLKGLGLIRNVISATHTEELNGENTLEFEAILDARLSSFITKNTIFEYENQYFDMAAHTKNLGEDGAYTVSVEAEHVSYRLNRKEYNTNEPFDFSGTPGYILQQILHRTEFSVGVVEPTEVLEYYVEERTSRRKLLMDFVDRIECDVIFNNFEVSIVNRRGSSDVKSIIPDRKIKSITQTIDSRTLDDNGNPSISYEVQPVYFPEDDYKLGDDVVVVDSGIGLKDVLRVISIGRNPYDESDVVLKFGKLIRGLESGIRDIDNKAGKNTGLPPPILDPRSTVSLSPVRVTIRNHPDYPGAPLMLLIYNIERDTATAQFVAHGYRFLIGESSIVYAFYEWEGKLSLVRMEQYNNTVIMLDNILVAMGIATTLHPALADIFLTQMQLPKLSLVDDWENESIIVKKQTLSPYTIVPIENFQMQLNYIDV